MIDFHFDNQGILWLESVDSELTEFLESEQQLLNYKQNMAAALQFLLLMSMFLVESRLTEGFLVFLS